MAVAQCSEFPINDIEQFKWFTILSDFAIQIDLKSPVILHCDSKVLVALLPLSTASILICRRINQTKQLLNADHNYSRVFRFLLRHPNNTHENARFVQFAARLLVYKIIPCLS